VAVKQHQADYLPSYRFGSVLGCGDGAIFGEKELQSTSYFCHQYKQLAKLVHLK
jgi:hypothetical protein